MGGILRFADACDSLAVGKTRALKSDSVRCVLDRRILVDRYSKEDYTQMIFCFCDQYLRIRTVGTVKHDSERIDMHNK